MQTLFAAGADGGVSVSTNSGTSWVAANAGFPKDQYGRYPSVTCFAASGSHLFAGTKGSGIFQSTDNGISWSQPSVGPNPFILCLAVSGTQLLAGTSGAGVFLSTDSGANWSAQSQGLSNLVVRSLAVAGSTVFAGTAGGVFTSSNAGARWMQASDGLTNVNIHCLAVAGMDLFAGTFGSGVWQRTLSEMVVSVPVPGSSVPAGIALDQNYPNPFNPTTMIRYALPERASVTLTVCSLLGEKVAVLVKGEKEAGVHMISFNASGMASGVYLYRLEAGDFVQSRALVILK